MPAPDFERFEIRAATTEHRPQVRELARLLNTVNLPDDAHAVARLLETSEASFAEEIEDPAHREYVFLLYDRHERRAVGTSMIVSQLGRRDAPYIYFDVRREEKYSATLDRHFVHTLLYTMYSYDGPTELGGLVMDPGYRRRPERLGQLVSFVRFLFIAMRRAHFRDQLLAELLPPLEADGTSRLWESVGRRFTGLSYQHADKLSRRNKEFIRGLFPDSIYATLLAPETQAQIGKVGPQTLGVAKILSRIGFRYAERVDPFDGGPHFIAATDEVTIIKRASPCVLVAGEASLAAIEGLPTMLIGTSSTEAPYFVAVPGPVRLADGIAHVSGATRARLELLGSGSQAWCAPIAG
ncbi:MAG: arginine N-succinyltransferase [Myxococcales bacterium]|nr:arginine N-succinyltransferase [Myxococcales bacterium]MDD9971635.1 arginine N-succinyltransferase [Myxococcales bacterium]